MLDIFSAIRQRRAVKHFDAQHVMPLEAQNTLINLAQQTPSSFNIQHWRLVRLVSPSVRMAVREAAWGQEQITDASLVLVLCADIQAWQKSPQRYWETAPQATQDILLPMIAQFYQDRPQVQRDEALRSVGLIAQTIMLAAQGLGYDSCPIIGFDADVVSNIIRLPQDHLIGMIITIGKASKPAHAKGGFLPISDILMDDGF